MKWKPMPEEEDGVLVHEGDATAEGPFTRNDLTFLKSLRITTEEGSSTGGDAS